ncbi:hypothetical protein PSHT_14914 [Puccinia striiformis]|uniref:Uncharacterized protein n=1 Tax=Puccinia striiformis TaxID=27350 RepID=A0A2S4UHS0_9BASI|nr:hypothetical protein PSHT_14914 [Puccinia striiformis]
MTFLAMRFGYRQIDMISITDNTLLKNILGIDQHPKIVFEVKFKTCDGKHGAKDLTPPQGCNPRKIHLTLAFISTGTTERNAGALAAVVGAAAGPVISTGIIKAVGFQAASVLFGSPAAGWMVSIGAVQAGSLIVVLQGIGAVGLGPLGIVLFAAGWASVGWGVFKSFTGQR